MSGPKFPVSCLGLLVLVPGTLSLGIVRGFFSLFPGCCARFLVPGSRSLIVPESDHHALSQTPTGIKSLNPQSISQGADEFSCRHSTGLCCLNSHNRIASLKQISSKWTLQSSCTASAVNSSTPPTAHRFAPPVIESLQLKCSWEAAVGW